MNLKYQLLQVAAHHKGQVRGRYAPSPSGVQHLGNIRTAIVAWLQVRLAGGAFILRMDDIDSPRVKAGSAAQIMDDLRWLGLDWDVLEEIDYVPDADKTYTQTCFIPYYQTAFESLRAQEALFPCRCSRRDIRRQVAKPNAAGHYVYPGTCRHKSVDSFAEGQAIVWRFLVNDEVIKFSDVLMGNQKQNVEAQWGDLIVKRNNGLFAYQLVSVVDDIEMGITDVVRGADLLDSTASQIALFQALGARAPRFWHVPLKMDDQGSKLAKRDGSNSLLQLREQGLTTMQIIGRLGFELGLTPTDKPIELYALRDLLLNSVKEM